MLRPYFICFFLFLWLVQVNASFSQTHLSRRKIGASISVKLPDALQTMQPEDIAQRYPSVRTPLGAFTNADRMADFSVNISATQWPDTNVDIAKGFFRASILNMFDRVDILKEGIHELHRQKFIFFEFTSRMNAGRGDAGSRDQLSRYTYIMYLLEPGRTLVFTFTCTADIREQWQPVAESIMKSVRVK